MNTESRCSQIARGVGSVLIALVGLIHWHEFSRGAGQASYLSLLWLINVLFAAIALVGIARNSRAWGWGLGLIAAGGAFVAYLVSETIGLPDYRQGPITALAALSLAMEAGFMVVAGWMLIEDRTRRL